jgi:hypothetical protein
VLFHWWHERLPALGLEETEIDFVINQWIDKWWEYFGCSRNSDEGLVVEKADDCEDDFWGKGCVRRHFEVELAMIQIGASMFSFNYRMKTPRQRLKESGYSARGKWKFLCLTELAKSRRWCWQCKARVNFNWSILLQR